MVALKLPPTNTSHYFCFQIPLSPNPLSLGSPHRKFLGFGPASRLLPYLLGLFPGPAHRPSPAPLPGSSYGPRRVPDCSPRLAPPFSFSRKSRPVPGLWPARPTGLQVWSFASGRPEGRRFGPSVPTILEFLYWSRGRGRWRRRGPHARGESAATNRRVWRRRPRESAAQTEAARRALRAEGRGRRAGCLAAGGRRGPATPT